MRLVLPRLYVILDSALLKISAIDCARELAEAGVRLMQYRDKNSPPRDVFATSQDLAALLVPRGIAFYVHDRADIAALAGATGVHVGQEDLGVEQARELIGGEKRLGVSTHNIAQFEGALKSSADYIAVGPIFPTGSKANPAPVVGLPMIRRLRALTDKPIVAIGGITLETAAQVREAGADSVAVISDILRAESPGMRARRYIEILSSNDHASAV
jgi:thiamine-phosphate pyrophosphorylase